MFERTEEIVNCGHTGVALVAGALVAAAVACATRGGADRPAVDRASNSVRASEPARVDARPALETGTGDTGVDAVDAAETEGRDVGPSRTSKRDEPTAGRDAGPDCPDDSGPTGLLACDRLAVGSTTRLDFDGDGEAETVRYQREEDRYVLEVSSPDGRSVKLGSREGPSLAKRFYTAEDAFGPDAAKPYRGDFGWVVRWEVVRSEGGVLSRFPGWKVDRSLGDGLLLSSLDVQLLLYRSEGGWVVLNLGY